MIRTNKGGSQLILQGVDLMKMIKWLDEHLEEYLLIALSTFTVVVIFGQVYMRYVRSSSLTWSEEIARYAFIWMIYIGVSYGVKKGKHLGVDAFSELFQEKGKIILAIIANVSFLVFSAVVIYFGFDIVLRITRESAALQLPMGWVYVAPVVGMILTMLRLLQKTLHQIKVLRILNDNKSREEII